jgi:hypothetical protein
MSPMPGLKAEEMAATRSTLEKLPKWLICIPLAVQWCWLGLRHGGLTLPSAANPNITAGGLVGEGKIEYFEQMGPLGRAATAPYLGLRIVDGLSEGAPGVRARRCGHRISGCRQARSRLMRLWSAKTP